jgi:hypothetical protein
MLDRETIFARYPWLAPGDMPCRVVTGDDLDSALSALLFLARHPGARIGGIYVGYTTVYYSGVLKWSDVLDAVWLDLDIYAPECRSLGHHIVRLGAADALPGLSSSCNLNELRRRSVEDSFIEKYPLGTAHFLMWLYEQNASGSGELLTWLADSAYINGQIFHYGPNGGRRQGFRQNVERWLEEEIPLPSLLSTFGRIDDRAFDERMLNLQQRMEEAGFRRGKGQVASRHLKLSGYQCQPEPDEDAGQHMLKLIRFASDLTGWAVRPEQIEPLARLTRQRRGARRMADVDEVRRSGLDRFLNDQAVFSYVFQTTRMMNYTTGLDESAR